MHQDIAIAAARAGKMVMCEKPLAGTRTNRKRWSTPSKRPASPNMVWYNYRRVPAVTLLHQLIGEGKLGTHLSLSRQVPAGLDDLPGSAAGRRRPVAPRCQCRRQRCHRRFAGALHRYRAVAERTDCRSHRDDRNVHQGTQTQSDRQSRTRRHRRCQRFSGAVRERLARDVRSHALRARAQGALHARDQRRACLGAVGSARSPSPAVVRSPRRRTRRAAGAAFTLPMAIILYMKHWWVPGSADRIRALVHPPVRRFSAGRGRRQSSVADVPRGLADRLRHRRRAEVGTQRPVGESWRKRNRQESRDDAEAHSTRVRARRHRRRSQRTAATAAHPDRGAAAAAAADHVAPSRWSWTIRPDFDRSSTARR